MEKKLISSMIIVLVILAFLGFTGFTGRTVSEDPGMIGPALEEQKCMKSCVSKDCEDGDLVCMESHGTECMSECGAVMPDQTEDEKCVESCVQEGCDKYDFSCQTKNKDKCDKECGMVTEPEAQSEEEQCIRDCVAKVDPTIMCQAGTSEGEGETGNEVCQRCAQECVHLYAGPCLSDEEITEKENACNTCEHCYGEPVMGDSGEGYQCIVDISCEDASSEFGDEPGTGPGITATFEKIGDFFKNLFGGSEEPVQQEQTVSNNRE